jgi:hypothetical protein
MTNDLPAELNPEDLPDDPELLKHLVCDLYATVMASEELLEQTDDGGPDNETGLWRLIQHLATGGPAGHDPAG